MQVVLDDSISVGIKTVKWLNGLIKEVEETKPESLSILMSSNGGTSQFNEVISGQVEKLENLTDVTIVNTHTVASAGVDLFMMFKKRKMLYGSYFLIHNNSYTFAGENSKFIKKYLTIHEKKCDEWFDEFLLLCVSEGMTKYEERRVRSALKNDADYTIFEDESRKWGLVNV